MKTAFSLFFSGIMDIQANNDAFVLPNQKAAVILHAAVTSIYPYFFALSTIFPTVLSGFIYFVISASQGFPSGKSLHNENITLVYKCHNLKH